MPPSSSHSVSPAQGQPNIAGQAVWNAVVNAPGRFIRAYQQRLQLKKSWQQLWQTPDRDMAVLDGLRGLAMLMVILLHCVYGVLLTAEGQQKIDWVSNAPLWLSWIFQARGADIIFLLSAFLVTNHCLQRARSNDWRIRHFYWRRLLRIYPLFLVALLVYLLLDQTRIEYLLSNLLMVVNLFPGQGHIIPVGWSITVQAQFYLLLPVLVFLLKGSRYAIASLLALLVLANLMRWFTMYNHEDIFNTEFYRFYTGEGYAGNYGPLMYYSLHTRFEPFVLGMLLAYMNGQGWIQRSNDYFRARPLQSVLLLLIAVLCLVLPCVTRIHHPEAFLYQPFNPDLQAAYLAMHRLVFSVGVFLLTFLLLLKVSLLAWFRYWLEIPAWRVLSQMIYPVYLFHMLAILIAAVLILSADPGALAVISYNKLLAVFLLAIPVSLLMALPFHLFIEKPFIRFARAPHA